MPLVPVPFSESPPHSNGHAPPILAAIAVLAVLAILATLAVLAAVAISPSQSWSPLVQGVRRGQEARPTRAGAPRP
jgi:hypothetical protein